MSVLSPLLREALGNFDIQTSPSVGGGFFVSILKLRRDTCERLEVLIRKTQHWEGGRSELARYIHLLNQETSQKTKLLVASLIFDQNLSQMIHKDGAALGPILRCIESAGFQQTLENTELPYIIQQLKNFILQHAQ